MHRDSRQEGMTLLELMVVLVFLSIGILALSAVQTRSIGEVHETGRSTRALELCEQQLEIARAAGYTLAVSGTGVVGKYTWTTTVSQSGTDLKQALTTVTWTESGVGQSVRLVCLLSNR